MTPKTLEILNAGYVYHQQGRIVDAERMYLQVLSSQPQQFDALYLLGVLKLQTGLLEEAIKILQAAVMLNPTHVDARLNLGAALAQFGRTDEAITQFTSAQTLDPKNPISFFNMGLAYAGASLYTEAITAFQKAIAIEPNYIEAINNLGNAYHKAGQYQDAADCFDKALSLAPNYPNALLGHAAAQYKLKQYDSALKTIDTLLRIAPNSHEAHDNRGLILASLGQTKEAIDAHKTAIRISPTSPDAHLNLGLLYIEQNRFKEAVEVFQQAIAFAPLNSDAYNNLGIAFAKKNKLEEAINAYRKSIDLNPLNADLYINLGLAHIELKQYDAAFSAYFKAIELRPNDANAYNALGSAFAATRQFSAAMDSYLKSLELSPTDPDVYNNLAAAQTHLNKYDEALAAYEKSIKLRPLDARAHNNLGMALGDVGKYSEALAALETAYKLNPSTKWLPGLMQHTRMKICDWRNFYESTEAILTSVRANLKVSNPFNILPISSSLSEQKLCAEIYTDSEYPAITTRYFPSPPGHKIRIGYISCDYAEHPVTYLTTGLIEQHDRSLFNVYGIDIGNHAPSSARDRIQSAFDEFYQLGNMSDKQSADFIKKLGLDILVDLTGHTKNARQSILAYHPASVQVNFLGFPGTMGASYIDYIIGDIVLIPENHRHGFTEKIVYMPDCFQANDSHRKIAAPRERIDFALPEKAFVFGCFNQCIKFTPRLFATWLSILKEVPNSVLWLFEENEQQVINLKLFATREGVSPDRLIFTGRLPYSEHLARYSLMDLALDTLPFNGGTTTSDALWGGAPVLSCIGESFAGRMTASLLNTIGLPELITHSLFEYKRLAIELGTKPDKLETIRKKLVKNRLTTPLFDTLRFTRNLESAYKTMVDKLRDRLPPDHFSV